MKKAVAFDLWDTLIYLEQGWKTFTQLKPHMAKDDSFWREKVKPFYLLKRQKSVESFLQDLKDELNIDLRDKAQIMENQLTYDLQNTKLYQDAIRTLELCKKRGLKLAVVSNQCSFYIPSFHSLGLTKYFDFILFSCELGYGKPDRRIYDHLSKLCSVPNAEIVFVGDYRVNDYEAPRKLGFDSVLLSRNSAQEGKVIRTLDELMEFI